MAKNAPFDIKSPVKNFHGRAKGGHRTVPPKCATGLKHNIVVFYSSCIMVLENTQLIEFLKSSNIN